MTRSRSHLWLEFGLAVVLAVMVGVLVGAAFGSGPDRSASLVTENRNLAGQVRELKVNAVGDAKLLAQMAQDKLARDAQDRRTQRLICSIITEVLRAAPSIGTNPNGGLASDCADRESMPLIPQRSQP